MRKNQIIIILGLLVLLNSNCSTTKESGDFRLLPVPQKFEISGSSRLKYKHIKTYYISGSIDIPVLGPLLSKIKPADNKAGAQIVCKLDQTMDMKQEGYTINITEKIIVISYKDKAGLLYGFMTLEQLLEDAKEQNVFLPMCEIVDYPMLAYRAIHIDVKHHLEKTEYYYKMIDKLARYKINAIIAEVEDKIKYKRQPEVASPDALSIEEWNSLCNYAMERNIEISPLVQGLGHASFILKHEKYKDLRDDPKSDWAFNPLNPETYSVQFDLYLDAIDATPHGKYLHVGGDEVHTTGGGSGKSALELQLTWLNKVCDFAEKQGRIPIFWDDMPLKHAGVYRPMFNTNLSEEEVDSIWEKNEHKLLEFLDQFPKNCIYMRWNYQTPQTIGNSKAMEWFRNNGLQVMGATAGQTRWKLMPQNESNMESIKIFANNSIKKGINGLLLTLWDDDSPHFELYWRGIIAFSEYTWSGENRTKELLKATYRQREFSEKLSGPEYSFIDQLEKSVSFWNSALLKNNNRNNLHKLKISLDEAVIDFPDKRNKGEWSRIHANRLQKAEMSQKECEKIAQILIGSKSKAIRNNYTLDIYEQVNEIVRFSPEVLLALKDYDNAQTEQEEKEIIIRIKQFPEKFRKLRLKAEQVYANTRILSKPKDYILDQDHHNHLANQSISFDWQFFAEELFISKLEKVFF